RSAPPSRGSTASTSRITAPSTPTPRARPPSARRCRPPSTAEAEPLRESVGYGRGAVAVAGAVPAARPGRVVATEEVPGGDQRHQRHGNQRAHVRPPNRGLVALE